MAKAFEVGKYYESYGGYDPILVEQRTNKTIWVYNGSIEWRMRIKVDSDGNEFVTDSIVPAKWREAFTYNAKWECDYKYKED